MRAIKIVEERAGYLLLAREVFAVVERRNGKLYNLKCGRRDGAPITAEGVMTTVGNSWCDEATARQTLEELASRSSDLAERIR